MLHLSLILVQKWSRDNRYNLNMFDYTDNIHPIIWSSICLQETFKGPGKRGHIVADTLLPKQMFPHLPARATFVADTNLCQGHKKMFLILFRNILCPQQMFPSLRSPRNITSNIVSATMCPRLPGPEGLPGQLLCEPRFHTSLVM